MTTIIILVLVGFLLVAAEMFLPGLVLGILGAILLIAAIITGYTQFGLETGTAIFVVVLLGSIVGFIIWMNLFPKTSVGRKLTLGTSLEPECSAAVEALVGKDGSALTPLRPAGTAVIDGAKIDVVAESAYIDPGEAVTVIAARGSRVVVRKKV